MAKKTGNPVEDAWNATKADDDPEFQQADPDFRAKLQQVYGATLAAGREELDRGHPTSGIAGLEKFEEEIRKGIKGPGVEGAPESGAPTLRDAASRALDEQAAEKTPKESGAQEGSPEKAAQDAAAKNASVEHDEEHSPSFPSAARPLGAESPANTVETVKAASKTAGKRTKASSTKTATKTSTKSTSKKK